MRVSLERLDARAVDLVPQGAQQVRAREIAGLRGVLEQEADRIVGSELAAEQIVLDVFRIVLGALELSAGEGTTLTDITCNVEGGGAALSLDVGAASVSAPALGVRAPGVRVEGHVTLAGMRLEVRDAEGSLAATRVEMSDLVVQVEDVQIRAERLVAAGVTMRWGAAPFELSAATLEARGVQVGASPVRLEADGLAAERLSIRGSEIAIGEARIDAGSLGVTLSSKAERAPSAEVIVEGGTPASPLFDWRVLDGLKGNVDVDLTIEVELPILGHRSSTHAFRVPIDDGALDYRRLESNLSALEDALLDFSLRGDALVLERGIPLLPTRGRGKPLVTWQLNAEDVALAESNRVRLSVLAAPRIVQDERRSDSSSVDDTPHASPLRRLELRGIHARLALEAGDHPAEGQLQIRQLDSLAVKGSVFHDRDGSPREGRLAGEMAGVDVRIAALDLGSASLDIERIFLSRLHGVDVAFLGHEPSSLRASFVELAITNLTSTPEVSSP